jgi:hypothetical protein
VNERINTGFARGCFLASVVVIALGAVFAARLYPTPFDWTHDVMSALASRKHNPAGFAWFAGALVLSMALLWPATAPLNAAADAPGRAARFSMAALRFGLIAGVLVGVERLVFFHLSDVVRKAHEILALLTFLGIYAGVLGLYAQHLRRRAMRPWPVVIVALPLVAIGLSQLILYLGQRDPGWLDHDWRQTGRPVWLSFAFWQWLATAGLWAGIGHLLFSQRSRADGP